MCGAASVAENQGQTLSLGCFACREAPPCPLPWQVPALLLPRPVHRREARRHFGSSAQLSVVYSSSVEQPWAPAPRVIHLLTSSMSSSNCCFLTYIQISQEAGLVVWYSHLFNSFPQFLVIYTVSFCCGSAGKESACNTGDLGSSPGLGRSPGEGKGYPLQ